MQKKLMASGIILLILGSFLMVVSKENVTQIERLSLYITGHALAVIGLVLAVTALTKIIAERL